MIISLRTITVIVFLLYFFLTCYTGYILLKSNSSSSEYKTFRKVSLALPDDGEEWNPWGEEFEREKKLFKETPVKWFINQTLDSDSTKKTSTTSDGSYELHNVEIWGKAAIGLYLWEHILNGKLETKMDGIWSYGFKRIDNLKLKFRTGPGVIATKAPSDVVNLVMILNGRSTEKIDFAKMWLDFLPEFHNLKTVVLVLLGNERCENDWLLPYTSKFGGLINTTFITYDSPLVDNSYFYQWPLGVATYRGFPKVDAKKLDLESSRPYICNFLGTIYQEKYSLSSREKLFNVIKQHNLTQHCFVKVRNEWQPKETKSSLNMYIQSLRLSDLTLNPVGQNSECYRIYEAMSFGSVPVVEDVMTPGQCGDSKAFQVSSPLKLLKNLNAPIIYIKSWQELPYLILKELKMTLRQKIVRRMKVIQFYENFKLHFREQLLSVIKSNIAKS